MVYSWHLGLFKQVVLGIFSGDFRRDKYWLIKKIRRIILTGNITLAKESTLLFLENSEYDFKKNIYKNGPEYAIVKIIKNNGRISVIIDNEFSKIQPQDSKP